LFGIGHVARNKYTLGKAAIDKEAFTPSPLRLKINNADVSLNLPDKWQRNAPNADISVSENELRSICDNTLDLKENTKKHEGGCANQCYTAKNKEPNPEQIAGVSVYVR